MDHEQKCSYCAFFGIHIIENCVKSVYSKLFKDIRIIFYCIDWNPDLCALKDHDQGWSALKPAARSLLHYFSIISTSSTKQSTCKFDCGSTTVIHCYRPMGPLLATSRALWCTWRRSPSLGNKSHCWPKYLRYFVSENMWKPLKLLHWEARANRFHGLRWTVHATNLNRAQIVATNLGTGKELRELILCPNPRPHVFSASPNPNLAPYQKVAVDQVIQL